MIETLPLFTIRKAGPRVPPPLPKNLTPRKRRTALVIQKLDRGKHPATGLPLHPEAPTDAVNSDRGREFTCGACSHLVVTEHAWGVSRTFTCELTLNPRMVRKWWPACAQYKPEEQC